MSDNLRSAWDWDLVVIGCGKSKRAERSRAFELYTGPVFKAHWSIAAHLDCFPSILSAEHGVVEAGRDLDPYNLTLAALSPADLMRWNDGVLHVVAAMAHRILADRRYAFGFPGMRERAAKKPEQREGDGRGDPAFGPPLQPSVLVLAGAPYVDGWADRARALGVRVDDPLRGYELGERRRFAARFVAETPRWSAGDTPDDIGWTRREQLLGLVDQVFGEQLVVEDDDVELTPTSPPPTQLALWEAA